MPILDKIKTKLIEDGSSEELALKTARRMHKLMLATMPLLITNGPDDPKFVERSFQIVIDELMNDSDSLFLSIKVTLQTHLNEEHTEKVLDLLKAEYLATLTKEMKAVADGGREKTLSSETFSHACQLVVIKAIEDLDTVQDTTVSGNLVDKISEHIKHHIDEVNASRDKNIDDFITEQELLSDLEAELSDNDSLSQENRQEIHEAVTNIRSLKLHEFLMLLHCSEIYKIIQEDLSTFDAPNKDLLENAKRLQAFYQSLPPEIEIVFAANSTKADQRDFTRNLALLKNFKPAKGQIKALYTFIDDDYIMKLAPLTAAFLDFKARRENTKVSNKQQIDILASMRNRRGATKKEETKGPSPSSASACKTRPSSP